MPKKKGAKKKTAKGADDRQRYARFFDQIEQDVESREIPEAIGIIRALRYVALELTEMNVSSSELMAISEDVEHIKGDLEYLKNSQD